MEIHADRLQDRDYLISMISKYSSQHQVDDLRLLAIENLRVILSDCLKKQQDQKLFSNNPNSTPNQNSSKFSSGLSAPIPIPNHFSNRVSSLSPLPNSPFTSLGGGNGGAGMNYGSLRSFSSIGNVISSSPTTTTGPSSPIHPDLSLSNDVLRVLEQICNTLDKDTELQEKVRSLRDKLLEVNQSRLYSMNESSLIKKDLHRNLFNCILNAYQVRHNDLLQLIAKKYLQPETEKILCENQQALYQLLCQYQKMIL